MARKPRTVDEKTLSKGQLRKLEALRKSLGSEIADRAFAEWLKAAPSAGDGADRNAQMIEEAIMSLIREQNLQFPRGGYIVRRGRGRVIVERPSE